MLRMACLENFHEKVSKALIGEDASYGYDCLCIMVFDIEEPSASFKLKYLD